MEEQIEGIVVPKVKALVEQKFLNNCLKFSWTKKSIFCWKQSQYLVERINFNILWNIEFQYFGEILFQYFCEIINFNILFNKFKYLSWPFEYVFDN